METKTMNSVKKLKAKIAADVKEDFDFEQYLFKKYPDLFYTDEEGELLPQIKRCWNDCPKGWETLVDNLFGAIVDYTKNTSRSVKNPDRKLMYFMSKLWNKLRLRIDRCCNAYRYPKNIFYKKVRKLTSKITSYFYKQDIYISKNPATVKIAQYKEKFGSLRIYTDGGDEAVEGMIRFAEYLSQKTCQATGKPGSMVQRGSWWATLSPKEAKRLGYKPHKK
jgi:hypothetical protein